MSDKRKKKHHFQISRSAPAKAGLAMYVYNVSEFCSVLKLEHPKNMMGCSVSMVLVHSYTFINH